MKNASEIDFRTFSVSFPGHTEAYGKVEPGATSGYRRAYSAYPYAYTEAYSGIQKFVLQPVDFVGTPRLPPGVYTYEYSASPSSWLKFDGGWILRGQMQVRMKDDSEEA
ncbi:MAG: hypothetical protein ACR2PZ_16230 [Pseudomonadales bacterium]